MLMTHVDLIEKLLNYNTLEKVRARRVCAGVLDVLARCARRPAGACCHQCCCAPAPSP